jgi:hypothetical protein
LAIEGYVVSFFLLLFLFVEEGEVKQKQCTISVSVRVSQTGVYLCRRGECDNKDREKEEKAQGRKRDTHRLK